MPRCDTHMNHCTSCGSYALKDVAGDHGFRRTSACCSAPVSAGACSENHLPYIPANRKTTEATIRGRKRREVEQVERAPGTRGTSHANCDHPSTSAARRACRKARA